MGGQGQKNRLHKSLDLFYGSSLTLCSTAQIFGVLWCILLLCVLKCCAMLCNFVLGITMQFNRTTQLQLNTHSITYQRTVLQHNRFTFIHRALLRTQKVRQRYAQCIASLRHSTEASTQHRTIQHHSTHRSRTSQCTNKHHNATHRNTTCLQGIALKKSSASFMSHCQHNEPNF